MRFLLSLAVLLVLAAGPAYGQGWPQRSVRFLVPFPPGGSTDVAARALADKMSAGLGQQVVVENRGGGGGAVGAAEVARAAPDGYTILFAANAVSILHLAVKNLPYDTLRDFVAITQVTTQPNTFAVHPSVPAASIKELVAYAKANPGKLSYGHSGAGGSQHLTGELLKKMAGIDMVGIPYKGGGQLITDLIGGQIQVGIAGTTPFIPHHRAGRIKILALTSREVIGRLHDETVKALKLPDVNERLVKAGLQPVGNTPEQFTSVIRNEIEQFGKLAKELGIEPQ